MARVVYLSALIFCALGSAWAAEEQGPLTVIVASDRYYITPGETITLRVFVRNDLVAGPPILLTAEASFTDDGGNTQLSTAGAELTVNRTVHVRQLSFSIPGPLAYVAGTAVWNGQPVSATAEGQSVSVLLDTDIAEQGSVALTLDVASPAPP